ncbi:Rpn family recombination-promoting nuclease/putative transposase [Pseudogracilibacillus sp. SO30301A]|uniref:Rpn family recombination-promoting nuclease/putative transposase n=1 Tax=Pseudogracilibacillus sp. SO30301A TaxID=3098291 RepID=UPI00300E57E2
MSVIIFPNENILKNEFLAKENSPQYTKHDQLFKQLIHTFFEEFLDAFFPEIHEQIDFQSTIQLSEEFFTDLINGDVRRLDILVQARIKETESFIVAHIEPQSTVQTYFNERMFQYFSLLYHKFRKPIIPIAVYSYEDSWDESEFNIHFNNQDILKFNYFALHLRKQKWREYINKDNPVVAALLSKMGFSKEERVQVKIEFLRMLVRLQLDPAKERLVYGFFESYLKLTDEEEGKLMEEARRFEDADEILEIPISYEERGKKKGLEQGIEQGLKEGLEQGLEQGLKEGLKEGLERGKKEVALELLKKGIDIELIKEATKLNLEEIEQLKKQLER